MTTTADLLNAITSGIRSTSLQLNLSSVSIPSDLFEVYIFTLVLRAAEAEGALLSYEDVSGHAPRKLIFRTSPGNIYSTHQAYTHAVLEFTDSPSLEVHMGVRVVGQSNVLHECDVAVVERDEAETCRRNRVPPRSQKVLLAVECKFYSTNLPLNQARAFIGLVTDLSSRDNRFFVFNTSSRSVERFLSTRHPNRWRQRVVPSSNGADAVKSLFQATLNNFKARRS